MSPLNRIGQAAARHAWVVLALWSAGTVIAVALAAGSGGTFTDRLTIPGAHSQRAIDLLEDRFPEVAGTAVTMVFRAEQGSVRDPAVSNGIEATLAAVGTHPYVAGVTNPFGPNGAMNISADGTIAFATIQFEKPAGELAQPAFDRLDEAANIGRAAGLQVEFGGELLDYVSPFEGSAGEGVGLVVALVILLIAFGSIVAAGLPIVTALIALTGGISLVLLLAANVDISTTGPTIAAMLGLGAGIDYALFITSRFREQLRHGHTVVESAGVALETSGRAVLFAGSTVVVSILGLWLADLPFAGWLGTVAAIVVAVTVLAAITLLPALLGLLGPWIDRLHLPGLARRDAAVRTAGLEGSGWIGWSRRVVERPWPYLLASLAILLVLAAPVVDLRLGQPDQGSAAVTSTQRRAYDLLARGFGPGVNGPLHVVVEMPPPGGTTVLEQIEARLVGDPDVALVMPPRLNTAGDTAVITVVPRSAPQAEATKHLLDRLTNELLPASTPDRQVATHVAGVTATYLDLDRRIEDRLPLIIAGVIAVSFLLLLVAFRSFVVAVTAAVLNALSLAAAYGVVVAVFQWGWGLPLVGLDEAVPIQSFVPMFIFAILFGLSMDYEVFLLSRIREAYVKGADTKAAVVGGVGSTARVITSAAFVMIAVFLSFVPVSMVSVKMIGVGLATAVLVDATIVRVMLLPAAMAILGKANWWIPDWLDRRLPHFALEPSRVAYED